MRSPHEENLVAAVVDPAKVGDRWPLALVKLIEAHEVRHDYISTRKNTHVLIDRYAALYFPELEVTWAGRHDVIATLSDRCFTRFDRRVTNLLSAKIKAHETAMTRCLSPAFLNEGAAE